METLDLNQIQAELVPDDEGVLTTKNGKKAMQYKKKEEDVLDEELNKLIESAYACFSSD